MGVKIWPSVIEDNMSKSNAQLDNLTEAVESGTKAFNELIEAKDLQGVAWGSTKTYFQEIQIPILQTYRNWIETQKEANHKYADAARRLPPAAELCQDTLYGDKAFWENVRREFEYETNPLLLVASKQGVLFCNTLIWKIESKLQKIQEFIDSTNGIYDNANVLKDSLANIDANLGKVTYNPATHVYDYSGTDASWIDAMAKGFLMHQGITEEQIDNMAELGYGVVELREIVVTLSPTDLEFFKCLMTGTEASYIEAFGMNPTGLSDNINVVLAHYASRLISLDESGNATDTDHFTMFTNVILGKREELTLGLFYREIYLEKLYFGSEVLLLEQVLTVSSMEKGSEGYNKEYIEYKKRENLASFWVATNAMGDSYADGTSKATDFSEEVLSISNFEYTGGVLNFNYNYSHDLGNGDTPVKSIKVNINSIPFGDELDQKKYLNKLTELQEAKNEYMALFIAKVAIGVGILALTPFAPQIALIAGTMASMGMSLIEGSTPRIPTGNISMDAGINLLSLLHSYYADNKEMDEKTQRVMKDQLESWMGAAGTFKETGVDKVIAHQGLINPDTVRLLGKVQKNGISEIGFVVGEDGFDKREEIIEVITPHITDIPTLERYKSILRGGNDVDKNNLYILINDLIKIQDEYNGAVLDVDKVNFRADFLSTAKGE